MTRPNPKEPGYDGERPVFMPARDITAKDTLTGRIVRETPDGPQNVNTDRIEWLFARKKITPRQHKAANQLQKDWQQSEISPCKSTLAMPIAGGGGRNDYTPVDDKFDAGNRFTAAKRSLTGKHLVVVDLIVLKNWTLQQSAKFLQTHEGRVSERLETALDMLADHYRLPPDQK